MRSRPTCGRSTPLAARWSLVATAPDAATTPAALHALLADPGTQARWLEIPGPSTVAAALRAIGLWSLDGPSRRFDAEDWWFRAELEAGATTPFAAPPSSGEASAGRRRWVFDGLAGACDVWLGDRLLLRAENTHRSYAIDAPEPPRPPPASGGAALLLLRFPSLDRRLAVRRPRPRWRAPMVDHPQLRHERVALLGRASGWSPPAAPVGPWRGVRVEDAGRVELADLKLDARLDGGTGRLGARFDLRSGAAGACRIEAVTLELRRGDALRTAPARRRGDGWEVDLDWPDAAPWWPHTHGEPSLYRARLTIRAADLDARGGAEAVAIDLGSVGFRTISVATDDGDFALAVNGVPVFCRGACWLPIDPVALAADARATRATLVAARDAGLNTIRVAGVGLYADDAFFDACDALGLLVWHDLMFASQDVPEGDPAFAAEVAAEVAERFDRWQGRASLAVVCGNSEVAQQAAMWGAPRAAWASPLYEQGFAELCAARLPGVCYWPSSAHGGALPHQTNAGTCSYYGVGAYRRPLDDARRAGLRFATECLAFANVPPEATLLRVPGDGPLRVHSAAWKARVPRDRGAGWDFDDIRDAYLASVYRIDPVALRSTDHARYLEMSRALGAEVVGAAFAAWRRPGSGCRGALVWTLRDLVAGAGWGLLDELGVPKAALRGLARAAAPVAVFVSDEGTSGLEAQIVNDPPRPLAGRLEVALYREDGLRLEAASRPVEVPAHGALALPLAALFDRFVDLNAAHGFGPVEHALVVATLSDAAGARVGDAFFCVGGLPNARRRDVGLAVADVRPLGGTGPGASAGRRGFEATVSCRGFAQSLAFDVPGFIADDESFHLAPGGRRTVRFHPAPEGHGAPGRRGAVGALNAWDAVGFDLPSGPPP